MKLINSAHWFSFVTGNCHRLSAANLTLLRPRFDPGIVDVGKPCLHDDQTGVYLDLITALPPVKTLT